MTPNLLNRRSFLGNTTLLGAGLAASSVFGQGGGGLKENQGRPDRLRRPRQRRARQFHGGLQDPRHRGRTDRHRRCFQGQGGGRRQKIRPAGRPLLRRLRRLSEGDRYRLRLCPDGHSADIPPGAFRGRRGGRKTLLHRETRGRGSRSAPARSSPPARRPRPRASRSSAAPSAATRPTTCATRP